MCVCWEGGRVLTTQTRTTSASMSHAIPYRVLDQVTDFTPG